MAKTALLIDHNLVLDGKRVRVRVRVWGRALGPTERAHQKHAVAATRSAVLTAHATA